MSYILVSVWAPIDAVSVELDRFIIELEVFTVLYFGFIRLDKILG